INRQNDRTHDPLDLALDKFSQAAKMSLPGKRIKSYPFEQKLAMSGSTWQIKNQLTTYLKGAPEQVLAHSAISANDRQEFEQQVLKFTQNGYRAIALARRIHSKKLGDGLTQVVDKKL